MKNKVFFYLIIILVLLSVSGIAYFFVANRKPLLPSSSPQPSSQTDITTDLPNPAAVYCQEQGGQSQIITAPDGSQTGECLFPDGSKCDEWVFFRHECQKGSKSNFSKEGNYVLIDGRPAFVYEEQGNPAISLYLQFVGETVCDFSQGEGTCNVH